MNLYICSAPRSASVSPGLQVHSTCNMEVLDSYEFIKCTPVLNNSRKWQILSVNDKRFP